MYSIDSFDKNSPHFKDFLDVPKVIYTGDPFSREFPSSVACIKYHKLFVAYDGDRPIGRVAAMFNPEIGESEWRTGLVGYYECIDSVEASSILLDSAMEYLKTLECKCCLGPMNGNTWQNYRFALPDEFPPFFLDNYHKPYYYHLFRRYSFREDSRYISSRIPREHFSFKRIKKFSERLGEMRVMVRKFRVEKFDEELQNIFTICLKSFIENLYYTPITWEEFKSLYLPVKSMIDNQFVLIAVGREQIPLGFVFALPNLLSPKVKSLVIKSVAVVPQTRTRGLGSYLVELVHKAAYDLGFEEIIHAMMHTENVSTRIGSAGSETFRNYALLRMDL